MVFFRKPSRRKSQRKGGSKYSAVSDEDAPKKGERSVDTTVVMSQESSPPASPKPTDKREHVGFSQAQSLSCCEQPTTLTKPVERQPVNRQQQAPPTAPIPTFLKEFAQRPQSPSQALKCMSTISFAFHHSHEADHNREVQSGIASAMATTLREALWPGTTQLDYSKEKESKLHIALLLSGLAMVLQCSKRVLAEHLATFQSDLSLSLQQTTEVFLSREEDAATCQIGLSSTTKTIGALLPAIPLDTRSLLPLIHLLVRILEADRVPHNIRADAAATIAACAKQMTLQGQEHLSDSALEMLYLFNKLVEEHASLLISTLSSTSPVSSDSSDDDFMKQVEQDRSVSLYSLAQASPLVRYRMVRFCHTVLMVARHLQHNEDPHAQREALGFCELVFEDPKTVHSLCLGEGDNYRILRVAIMNLAQDQTSLMMQLKCIPLLARILDVDERFGKELGINECEGKDVMDTLRSLSYKGQYKDGVVIQASIMYASAIEKHGRFQSGRKELWTLSDMTTFPFELVRSQVLKTIRNLIEHAETAVLLLESTEFLENISLIISCGCNEDRAIATDISRRLARSALYHNLLCRHKDFLKAVVKVVCQQGDIEDRKSQQHCVDTLLILASNKENAKYLLPYQKTLPWLEGSGSTTA